MLVLGIESTCDETGCAVVRSGKEILSNVVASQEEIHASYGGVVPELASRQHVEVIEEIYEKALEEAGIGIDEIDLLAVAHAPGLIGAIMVGLHFIKGLALSTGKPFIGVNHLEAHLYASMMEQEVPLPALGVVISGGHTSLLKVEGVGKYQLIGQTQDDAIGEAFDKAAKLLGLPYPGGPEIERLASLGDPNRYPLKAGRIKNRPYDFSFSGLKTGVFYQAKGQNAVKGSPLLLGRTEIQDLAASFQRVAFEDLVHKTLLAAKDFSCKSILLGGGVTQNKALRQILGAASSLPLYWPPKGLSLDNAAMIAGLAYPLFQERGGDPLTLQALPRTPFA
ncbi:MAG: tRNA N6-adenosine threonylcarbamoyltransferase [Chlamydiae bacterium]|nr:tRNA N6-adenosine threonylcarbamoyltransferase [Chlamydiota bacterium]